MIAGAKAVGMLRIQTTAGPPWKDESARRIRMLNHDLRETLLLVLKMQHDIVVDRETLLAQLWYLAHGRVEDAQDTVPRRSDGGGAHGKLEFLMKKGVDVLTEVHDLLLRVTRADQVSTVLGVLETQCESGLDLAAIQRLCGPDGPDMAQAVPSDRPDGANQAVHPHLTDQGRMLWQLLLYANPKVRAEGYALFLQEMEERAPLQPQTSQSLLATMPRSIAFSPRPEVPPSSGAPSSSSSNAPASDGSSPGGSPGGGGSTTLKRHAQRSIGSAPVADGDDVAGRANS
jgi:hypothetical protein